MKIRLLMSVGIDTKEHAETIYNAIKNNIDMFVKVGDDDTIYIEMHKCYHDETPIDICEILEKWENGRVTWHEGEPVP